ncbi:MAG: lysophospholipid acyltransferase family protein [Candidatus Zixiibacteriota bacterium]
MASLAHRCEYWIIKLAVGFAKSLSSSLADKLGIGLGRVTYYMWGRRRRIALENLRHAFGSQKSESELRDIARSVFENIGRTLVEFARFSRIGVEGAKSILVSPGDAAIRDAFSRGKGGVFITAHYGNWELLGMYPSIHGHAVDFVVGTQHNPLVDEMFIDFRRSMGVGIIPLKTALKGVFKALKQNHLVGLVADQHDPGKDLIIDFFGRPSSWPKGPAVFAIRSGAPIVPCLLTRERFDRHVIIAGDPIYHVGGDEGAAIRTMTEQYVRFFEKHIRAHPEQWMWTHRRWKM